MTQSPTFFLSNIDGNTTPSWLTASHGDPALTSGLHKSVARCVPRALSGTRTHTLQILSLLPLPIGLLGPARIGRRYHSCLTQTITFGLLYPSGPLGSYFRLLFAAYIGPITLRCTVAFYTVNNHSLFSFCSVMGRHYSGSCIGLTSLIRSYVFNTMGYRFTGTFESCPFKQVYVPHDKPYVGRPVGRREEFLQLASHKIPGLLHARVDCWRPYRSEPKRLFYFAQTKIFKVFFLAPFFL